MGRLLGGRFVQRRNGTGDPNEENCFFGRIDRREQDGGEKMRLRGLVDAL